MSNKYSDRPYTVGKGKPPAHTQFGKDRPGNRKGRPPGSKNTNTIIAKALAVRLTVKEGGKERKITKREALVTQLINKACSGETRAIDIVLRLMRDVDASTQPEAQSRPLSDADRAVLESFAQRLRDGQGGGHGQ
jgi:hypothetical protein